MKEKLILVFIHFDMFLKSLGYTHIDFANQIFFFCFYLLFDAAKFSQKDFQKLRFDAHIFSHAVI